MCTWRKFPSLLAYPAMGPGQNPFTSGFPSASFCLRTGEKEEREKKGGGRRGEGREKEKEKRKRGKKSAQRKKSPSPRNLTSRLPCDQKSHTCPLPQPSASRQGRPSPSAPVSALKPCFQGPPLRRRLPQVPTAPNPQCPP